MYEIFKLKKVQYYIEPSNSYAVNGSGSVTYKNIKVLEDSPTLEVNVEMVENKTMQQRIDGLLPKVNTRRRCNFSFTSYLNGTNVPVSASVLAVTSSNGDMLKTIMGGENLMSGSRVITSSATQTIIELGTAGTVYRAGQAMGFLNPTTNQLETSRITKVTTNGPFVTCSLLHLPSFTPASGSVVYGAANYYLTQDPNTSLQFYVEGANTNDTWVAAGLNGGFTLKTELGQLPEIAYKMENGATWFAGSTDNLQQVSYVDATPPPFVDGFVRFGARGADSATPAASSIIDVDTIEITPAIAYVDVTTERGVNNILRKRRNRVAPVATGKLVTYFTDKTYFTARDNSTVYFCELQVGNSAGNTVVISIPQIKITNTQVVATSTGLTGVEITFDILEDSLSLATATATTDAQDNAASAFSVHFV